MWAACCRRCSTTRRQELVASLDAIEAPGARPRAASRRWSRTCATRSCGALQEEYVATFDHTRKCALYLTYFAYGDTRRRGVALVQFKQAYREAGVEWDEETGELPDHLCAVLQFGATVDADGAWRLLDDHRAGRGDAAARPVRLAQRRRHDRLAVGRARCVALCATLPTLQGDEADAVRRLVEQGPPAEEVGLEGYGTDPLIAPGHHPRGSTEMSTFLWVIVPYLCLATFVVGHVWRYRYDKFGWTTRSSQLYEDRLLRLGSPLFHFGMLGVVGGHVIGLLVPRSWTAADRHRRPPLPLRRGRRRTLAG